MKKKSIDGNTAAAHIAYAFSEVVALYPITPSSPMGEHVDEWASQERKNLFGQIIKVAEMQSEAGAAGAVHGALATGAFCSTFTASQGLLLMIPNMYKIAGELMPCVFHVAARSIAGQALSIFGDHQDVMATRETGFCQICSGSVQEVMDLALVSHLASLRTSLPFVHFFDGFRTSHEIQKIEMIEYDEIQPLLDQEALKKHKKRALNPEHPHFRGSAQNPDIYFQMNETANPFYLACPDIVQEEMDKVAKLTSRQYHLFDYFGDPKAEKVIVMMGSGALAAEEAIEYLNARGEKVGLIKVRLYRPFSIEALKKAMPSTAKKIAVLDRTKENGAIGEPLYLDICATFANDNRTIIGGRYGLGSKEFTPSMAKAVFDNLSQNEPKNHFTVGINDDVTFTSLLVENEISTKSKSIVCCKFFGLGGDGTVGANKDAIKIIGDNTEKYVQGYFSYDSKKSFGYTVSHLRFGDEPIKSTYLIQEADYVACHHPSYVHTFDLLKGIKENGIFVLNSPWSSLEELHKILPASIKRKLVEKKVEFYNIDAASLGAKIGLGFHINMIMQTVFFKLANILPIEDAIKLLKQAIVDTYSKKSEKIVELNQKAVDEALTHLQKIDYPQSWQSAKDEPKQEEERPDFVKNIIDVTNKLEGDNLPVSSFTPGGIFPMGGTQYEKRNFATHIPKWIPENCIQCNKCAFVCPHAVIRPFMLKEEDIQKAPDGYQSLKPFGKGVEGLQFTIAISPKDCTGCSDCAVVCPGKDGKKALVMHPKDETAHQRDKIWKYALKNNQNVNDPNIFNVKNSQLNKPLFEFSGACAGCGETPYIKLVTQLFGKRMIIANATGCTSIYGGTAPVSPYTTNEKGQGPAWANSLFEDNAEYGFGMHLATSFRREQLVDIVKKTLNEKVDEELKGYLQQWLENVENGEQSYQLSQKIQKLLEEKKEDKSLQAIYQNRDLLTKPSIWLIGGDGWAYDIGYGGLDHVLAMNEDVNMLVLDTEVYSNTGGQASKSTPMGAIAKFAASGKKTFKKDLGLMAMTYGHVYVASVALGADQAQLVRAMKEAESYPGPSIIIAYATCIAHGIQGGACQFQEEEKRAVDAGYWFLYRYDPRREEAGENPFQLDSKEPSQDLESFLDREVRYNYLKRTNPEEAKKLHEALQKQRKKKYQQYLAFSKQL